ncbi:MAG TPA: hypothetical protein H9799_10285 [Candidatus Mediterraneibacter merdipullorum]|nr:hypothetical protein [Candidatus Mediterraneibacter merdipullorum]
MQGFLGELDEDLLLASLEEQMEELTEELKEKKEEIADLIGSRRKRLREKLLREHPEMTEYLEESRSHRMSGRR